MSANLSTVLFSKLPQNRHPERSASQVDSVTSAVLNLPMLLGAFQPPKLDKA
jgi:hypothetical protein